MSINQIHYTISFAGFVLAQIACLALSGRQEGDRSERSVIFNFEAFNFHFHHWMYGLVILIGLLTLEQYTGRNWILSMFKGVSVGLVFHGLVFYIDYFDIVKRIR